MSCFRVDRASLDLYRYPVDLVTAKDVQKKIDFSFACSCFQVCFENLEMRELVQGLYERVGEVARTLLDPVKINICKSSHICTLTNMAKKANINFGTSARLKSVAGSGDVSPAIKGR